MIREFRWEDLAQVHALWLACFGALKPEDAEQPLRRTLERNPGLFLVEDIDGRIAGTTLATTDGRRGFLYHVATHPEFQRRGIAAGLVREASRRLFAQGVPVVHLRVAGDNLAAIAFYESLGLASDPPIVGMRLTRGPS